MVPLMFLLVCMLLCGIAGMQYLVLHEQRETQFKLNRIRAAVMAFEQRLDDLEVSAPFLRYEPRTNVADMLAHSLTKRYGVAA